MTTNQSVDESGAPASPAEPPAVSVEADHAAPPESVASGAAGEDSVTSEGPAAPAPEAAGEGPVELGPSAASDAGSAAEAAPEAESTDGT